MDHHHHKFDPAHLDRLESPDRLTLHDPEAIAAALPLNPGNRVADIGCGTGFFTVSLARRVGENGKVWALDIEPIMLERVQKKVDENNLRQVEVIRSEESRLPLADGSADLAFMANVLHEAVDQVAFLGEAARILGPQGVLAVAEWRTDLTAPPEKGPPLGHRLSREEGERLAQEAGLRLAGEFPAGPQHWGRLFRKG